MKMCTCRKWNQVSVESIGTKIVDKEIGGVLRYEKVARPYRGRELGFVLGKEKIVQFERPILQGV